MSRRLIPAIILGLTMGPLTVRAMDAEALYYDQDYQGAYEAYDARLGESSKHRDELEYSAGTAAFKTENYGQAAEHLGRAILSDDEGLRSKAYYNLANTLFRLGQASEEEEEIIAQWEASIDHYAEAEALGGEMERNARHNREVVEQHLAALTGEEPPKSDDQEKQDSQDQNEEGDEQKEGQDGEGDSQENQDGEEGQNQDQQDQSKEGHDQQPQDGQDQQQDQGGDGGDGESGDEGQDQPTQAGEEGKEGEQEQGQEGKPGEEGDQSGEDPSQTDQDELGGQGKPGDEEQDLEGDLRAADDQGQKPEGDPKANQGPLKPSAYELTPDGKLSEAAARALLESLEGEEVKAPYEVRRSKQRRRVIRDW